MSKLKRKNIFLSKKIIIALLILFFIALVFNIFYILKESGIIKQEIEIEKKEFPVIDECSLIVGKIIHTIYDDGECANKCNVQCETYGSSMDTSNFTQKEGSCNTCQCFCK